MTFQQFQLFFDNFSFIFDFIVKLFSLPTNQALSFLLYHSDSIVLESWSGAFFSLSSPLYYINELFAVIINYVSGLNFVGDIAAFVVSVPLALVQFLSSSIYWIITGVLPSFILNLPFAVGLPFLVIFVALTVRLFKFVFNLVKVE